MERIPASGFRLFDHTADVGIEVWGDSLPAVFAAAARGLATCMGAPDTGVPGPPFSIEAAGIDVEDLLVCTLSELIAALELEGRYLTGVSTAEVREDPDGEWQSRLVCEGLVIDMDNERALVEVKAVTYHQLLVARDEDGWHARVLFDL